MRTVMWWAYLHSNGSIQVKRWFGDRADYRDDCDGNPFVLKVLEPFSADSHEEATEIAKQKLQP